MHTGIAFIYLLESCSFVNLEILSFLAITTPYANCTDGQLRLVGGTNIREGRVEICINNAWGTICDDLFDAQDARVVCTQMGFSNSGIFLFIVTQTLYVTILCRILKIILSHLPHSKCCITEDLGRT